MHVSTVCLALKAHPSIPANTRASIRRIARDIGYIPDPMLSALAAYRLQRRQVSGFQGTLAWLVNHTESADNRGWCSATQIRRYHEGATRRAHEYGYRLETFELDGPDGLQAARLASIFRARNIQGILLAPQPRARMVMHFPWRDFSLVTFGHSLEKPHLHTASPAHYLAMLKTMRELHRRGYRRPGFVQSATHDDRIAHQFLAAYLAEQKLQFPEFIPPLLEDVSHSPQRLRDWIREYHPDVIATSDHQILRPLGNLRKIGVVCCGLPDRNPRLAGVVEASLHVGEVALDFLVGLIRRGERGIPRQPHFIHVEGHWTEGLSLGKRKAHSID